MKKLYNGKGRRVHPAAASAAAVLALPAAVLTLASGLSAEEQEVLAYMLSWGSGGGKGRRRQRQSMHEPELGCGCFGCYKSFWARWDASPNRQLIHVIIDTYEETLESPEMARGGGRPSRDATVAENEKLMNGSRVAKDVGGHGEDNEEGVEKNEGDSGCKSSVRRLVSFVGGRVWGLWN